MRTFCVAVCTLLIALLVIGVTVLLQRGPQSLYVAFTVAKG